MSLILFNRKLKIFDLIVSLFFVWLLIILASQQIQFKKEPQIWMLVFGVFSIISYFLKPHFVFSLFFYTILLVLLYINFFVVINVIFEKFISPKPTTNLHNRGMNMDWMNGVVGGFILAPITVAIYHFIKKRNKKIELLLTIFFTIQTTVIYILYECL